MSDGNDQEKAEALDDDRVGGHDVAPEEPFGLPELLGRDVAAAGEHVPDSVAERTVREGSDVDADDGRPPLDLAWADDPGRLNGVLDEPDLDAPQLSEEDRSGEDGPAEAAAIRVVDGG